MQCFFQGRLVESAGEAADRPLLSPHQDYASSELSRALEGLVPSHIIHHAPLSVERYEGPAVLARLARFVFLAFARLHASFSYSHDHDSLPPPPTRAASIAIMKTWAP